MLRLFFPLGLFLSASLLFAIQPMVAKILLPVYGGAPQVWSICLLFFQGILLFSYSYVWALSCISKPIIWRSIHALICIASLSLFPFSFFPKVQSNHPDFNILINLVCELGLPLFMIGSSAPLLQHAYSQTKHKSAVDPYFLYSASNVGSLLALLSYPYILERCLGVHQQFLSWNLIYILFIAVLLSVLCFEQYQPKTLSRNSSPVLKKSCFMWIFQSFVACGLMLSVTFYISTDIGVTPLFWVIPLALYLVSFILTFAKKPLIAHTRLIDFAFLWLLIPIFGFFFENQIPIYTLILLNLLSFFGLALMCHGELVRTRPESNQLALFYFCLALGGVLAGLFNGLIAPHFFTYVYEYPIFLLLASFGFTSPRKKYLQAMGLSSMVVIAFGCLYITKSTHVLEQQRNFYGVKQVKSQFGAHILISQNTAHGFQIPNEASANTGTRGYYGSVLPVVQFFQNRPSPIEATVIGLGTGMLACQFQAKDQLTMIEIDKQVIQIASNPSLFTYLRDCPPHATIIEKDGRMAIADLPIHSQDLVVMDAFQSDAIPTHLLTLEAFKLYQDKIRLNGAILVNIANRHLRILPVLTANARILDMIILHKQQSANEQLGQLASEWALLTTNEALTAKLLTEQGWRFVAEKETRLWTNDYSNMIPLIKWGTFGTV